MDGLIGAKEGSPIYTVYILRSLKAPQRIYIGYTTNLEKRLYAHNHAGSAYTARFAPWELETHLVFKDKTLAKQFESYLKSGSGHAFLHKRLLAPARVSLH